ncbi:vanadium-dependent haloperoxidase [Cellulomonas xylanilytica]|uniref:Haloperoxidase n=1 Tax=Cellulomonas xylanilytica TaxID=233583 RepID=A0A510V212_9CELL|nr:vanadium-dependent haloperoxidase [Cellulomonas xylanilytica]GEK20934.1 haloperoxidase [Cellulomonas xylanilytica]
MHSRRRIVAAAAAVLLAPMIAVPVVGSAASAKPLGSSIAVDWQRTANRTIYTEAGSAPPLGALYLAFTSLAVHDAATKAQRHGMHAAAAAVATAAHDVLVEYFPASGAALDTDLANSLARVRDGAKQDAGVAIGAAAADRMIASRVDDGRFDPAYVYSKPPAPGVWQPALGGAMALPWLGYVDPVVHIRPVFLDGPDPITSAAYARDYDEVRAVGEVGSTTRTSDQTAIAQFFANNPMVMYRTAVCDLLAAEPLGLLPTTRLFARIDAAVVTSFIASWRLKYEIGYWRPFQAIAGADTDDNSATTPQDNWVPLVTNPAYADYTSGHANATSPFAQVLRRTLGDDTGLVLRAGPITRSYATLTALEHDALNARIWGGLHFRDAMDDGYYLGHTTADRVMAAVH